MKSSFILLTLLALGGVSAEEHEDIVRRAFESIDPDYRDEWAFTETSTEEQTVQVGRYDPRLPEGERWTLLSFDGRTPTAEEIEDYLAEKESRSGRRSGADNDDDDDGDNGVSMVTLDSLELVRDADDHWLFSFVPAGDDEEDQEFMRQVEGMLRIVKDGHYVENIHLQNDGTIKPAFGVKISTFMTDLTFGPVAAGGPIVPQAIDVLVQGRAYLAVKFDEAQEIRYSDYEYAGNRGEMVPDR